MYKNMKQKIAECVWRTSNLSITVHKLSDTEKGFGVNIKKPLVLCLTK